MVFITVSCCTPRTPHTPREPAPHPASRGWFCVGHQKSKEKRQRQKRQKPARTRMSPKRSMKINKHRLWWLDKGSPPHERKPEVAISLEHMHNGPSPPFQYRSNFLDFRR